MRPSTRPHPIAAVALCAALCAAITAEAVDMEERQRPTPLKKRSGCELWVGDAVGGNDPTIAIELRICPAGEGKVTGQTQWSSLQSGWNLRETTGRWEGDTLVMEDVRFIELKPNPEWRFCLIDRYTFRRDGRTLTGGYVSTPCNDHAELELTLEGETTRWPEDTPLPPTPPEQPTEDAPVTPDKPQERACGGCAALGVGGGGGLGWWLVGLLVLLGGRRSRLR